jgi:AP2-like factor, ANT lineage
VHMHADLQRRQAFAQGIARAESLLTSTHHHAAACFLHPVHSSVPCCAPIDDAWRLWLHAGTQEEAAEAYDIAAVKFRGLNAVTNFDITRYDVDKIMASNTLLPGDLARRVVKKQDAPRIDHDVLSGDAFSVLHDLVVTAADGGSNNATATTNSVPMSSASSLATSLSNSREASPDRGGGGLSMLFSKPPLSSVQAAAAKPTPMSPLPLGAWPSPAPAVSIAHLPMFAAWTDA